MSTNVATSATTFVGVMGVIRVWGVDGGINVSIDAAAPEFYLSLVACLFLFVTHGL